MEREEYKRILPKVVSIVPDTAVVGMLLTNNVKPVIVKSRDIGLLQHNALTWMVRRNRFWHTKQSALGSFIDNSQKEWLSNLDDETREMFVDTLFSLFEATGMATFDEMIVNRRTSAEKIMLTIRSLPKEKQEELRAVMDGPMQSIRHVAERRIIRRKNSRSKVQALPSKYIRSLLGRRRRN
jgi:hypothetical protein